MENYEIIEIIGSPFEKSKFANPDFEKLVDIYDSAFEDRVALLYLSLYRKPSWNSLLEDMYQKLENRRLETLSVISEICGKLNAYCPNDYVVFKSLKPYPATPNDTDILFLNNKEDFLKTIEYLYSFDYQFHEKAPLQTTLYDPRGKGKIGPGKLGGTYYIDCYREISTDFYVYINKAKLKPFIIEVDLMGNRVRCLKPEPELAIILFHNIFPEKTFQLEHFYLPLYYLRDENFDVEFFIDFAEKHRLVYPVVTNLSLVEYLHRSVFNSIPDVIAELINKWGRNDFEVERFTNKGSKTPYLFSGRTFWKTFALKSIELHTLKSLAVQGIHMLNPVFLLGVIKTLRKRFSKRGVYHLE
ncbi:hypothetical protein FJZ33_00555 [Candidatus Poribacteria bacterium]|nr:hypothetical protein [Candidatus Poribacteria bacterium]